MKTMQVHENKSKTKYNGESIFLDLDLNKEKEYDKELKDYFDFVIKKNGKIKELKNKTATLNGYFDSILYPRPNPENLNLKIKFAGHTVDYKKIAMMGFDDDGRLAVIESHEDYKHFPFTEEIRKEIIEHFPIEEEN